MTRDAVDALAAAAEASGVPFEAAVPGGQTVYVTQDAVTGAWCVSVG